MREVRPPGRRRGSSLLELILALLLFEVGLLAVAGMVLLGQRTLTRAQLTMRGTVAARRVGDSLLATGAMGEGEIARPWGGLRWVGSEDGGVIIVATGGDRSDTLAYLRLWLPPREGAVPDSALLPGGGGA